MFVDFSKHVKQFKKPITYDKKYNKDTTKFYRALRENKINVISQDNTKFYPEKSFKFEYMWDPYTGDRLEKDPHGSLYFHPDELIYYFYLNRLKLLWCDPVDDVGGYYDGYYNNGVGGGEDIYIESRGSYPEAYVFRLPICDCYLEKGYDMSIITMGPRLTNEEIEYIDMLAEKYYKTNYKKQHGTPRPSLRLMKSLYDQAISKNPDLSKLSEYNKLPEIDIVNMSTEKISEFKNKANRQAVDILRSL